MSSYMLDPNTVKTNPKFVGFNKAKTVEEFEALKASIQKYGQRDPVIMKDGLLYDGANRLRIAKELGIDLLCVDADGSLSEKDMIALCNTNTFTARNYSSTQKAIAGFQLVKSFGYSDNEACKVVGLKQNDKGIGYARTIAASPFGKENDVLDELMAGNAVTINGQTTKSIDTARRLIKKLEELENDELQDQLNQLAQAEIEIDYNSLIDSESLREMFWKWVDMDTVASKLEMIRILHVTLNVPTPKQIKELTNVQQ